MNFRETEPDNMEHIEVTTPRHLQHQLTKTPASSFDYDFGKLNDSDFWQAKQEVFAAAKSGQLR